ncbi:kinase-like protein [Amniculicola lignicola CBS 123094]|uniref:Kinase-like protein n=1 Tax=Amniculicola lignicola CBS 123094 TaxID=1392246 RepID=A0A6A5X143_9PLEO|nr:kinase-like protein [Amniculicola lignicola CBS 123094]
MDPDVFATLTPTSSTAKRAFSEVAALCRTQPPLYWKKFMHINPVQVYNQDDAQDLERSDAGIEIYDSEGVATSADEETVARRKELYTLWTGCYTFNLSGRDPALDVSWIAGKGRPKSKLQGEGVQFKLMHNKIRGMHARFFLTETGFVGITSFSYEAHEITVDGALVKRQACSFNKGSALVGIGSLHFEFTYTEYSRSDEFKHLRNHFWSSARTRKAQDASTAALALTPIPAQQTQSIGRWTLAKELGKGVAGKVYSATNSSGTVVAIKVVERNKKSAEAIQREINTLKVLTQEAKEVGCRNIILLEEVIGDVASNAALVFQDISLVFTPAAYYTMETVIASNEPFKRRMQFFQQLLFGIKFLHDRSWAHCDIKTANVGICQNTAVLLDMGQAQNIQSPSTLLNPTPGQCGTIGFLAPEQEMKPYDHSVDMWAVGIVGFALLFGYYPLQMSHNPWRKGHEFLREEFHRMYREMYLKLRDTYESGNLPCNLIEEISIRVG